MTETERTSPAVRLAATPSARGPGDLAADDTLAGREGIMRATFDPQDRVARHADLAARHCCGVWLVQRLKAWWNAAGSV
jgi:hypothetical protein